MAGMELLVRIAVDAARAGADIDRAASSAERFKSGVETLAVPAGIAAAGVIAFGKNAVDAESAAQQSVGAVNSVFGDSAGVINGWAAAAADAAGLSESSYQQMAAGIG